MSASRATAAAAVVPTGPPPALFDLSGYWLGDYSSHGLELVEVRAVPGSDPSTNKWLARKVTGDANVPAGKKTFETTYSVRDGRIVMGPARGRIAAIGYRSPIWITGQLRVLDASRFLFTWEGLGGASLFIRVNET
jgi:hypothetical protein